MTWLDNICKVLEHPQYPQIKGRLIRKTMYMDGTVTIDGKCALGEINCQIRGKEPTNYVFLRSEEQKEIGIPDEFIASNLPDFNPIREEIFYENLHTGLTSWIVALNDNGFTYPEIIEFLKTTFPEEVTK